MENGLSTRGKGVAVDHLRSTSWTTSEIQRLTEHSTCDAGYDSGVSERFAIALIGEDRPGILASLSGLLLELGCNLEDVSTSILGGHFAITLIASAPTGFDMARGRQSLGTLSVREGLTSALWEISAELGNDEPTHLVTLYGQDRPGIVHAIAEVCSGLGVNVCDMSCRLHHGGQGLYVVTLEAHIPAHVSEETFRREVADVSQRLGFESGVRSLDAAEL
jgi:glycine cleavage system transcriptional repressor